MAARRKKKKKKDISKDRLYRFLLVVVIALIVGCLTKKNENHSTTAEPTGELSIELAIPKLDKAIVSQVIEHTGYTVSYNRKRRNPNWVAYELTAEEVDGKEPRNGDFIPDPDLKGAQATDEDYKNCGWDRGHLAPAADMKWSKEAMEESFYLSNISPQNNNLNRGVWKSIEELTRDAAVKHKNVLVVTGPVFTKEKGLGKIGKNKVLIPNGFYKVLLINDCGYKGIGFYCENKAGKKKLSSYAVSIDSIENITGIDFFHMLPDEIENTVESEYNWNIWK
ncbi:MAG: DNA/RNA non-specific endonuclease [Bacteroidaceae bacterium]|nr:DNA/RNA non-specific endonuclease [Bacteroidaceae bacterium]